MAKVGDWDSDLKKLCADLNKQYKGDDVMAVTGDEPAIADITGFVSTGSLPLDVSTVLGHGIRGGVPLGRMVEVFGHESVGKSLLLTSIFACVQKGRGCRVQYSDDHKLFEVVEDRLPEGIAVLIDNESGFNKARAEQVHCDTKKLIILDGVDTIEDGFSAINKFLDLYENNPKLKGRPLIFGWDTLSSAPTNADYEGKPAAVAERAVLIRKHLKPLARRLAKAQASLIILNQSMEMINSGSFGSVKIEASGTGRGPRFFATIRWRINRTGHWNRSVKGKPRRVGVETEVLVVKNKLGPPGDRLPIPISFQHGIDPRQALFLFCRDPEFWSKGDMPIKSSGAYYQAKLPSGEWSKKFYERDWPKVLKETEGLRSYLHSLILSGYGSGRRDF